MSCGGGGRGRDSARAGDPARVTEVRCIFGLCDGTAVAMDGRRRARADAGARAIVERLCAGGVGLVVGPSGGGKTSILDAIQCLPPRDGVRVARARVGRCRSRKAPVSLVGGSVDVALRTLASAGLGDARVVTTPAFSLSDGEAFRLALARAMGASGSGGIVLVDEFCATLDGTTAMGVARMFSRWVAREGRRTGLRAVVATARDEMIEWLSPDLICWQGLDLDPVLVWRGADGRIRVGGEDGTRGTGARDSRRDRARVA